MKIGKISEKFFLCGENSPEILRSVGFFDSGIGGLNVVNACRRMGLKENLLYLGDNARAPYGERSEEEILKFSFEAFDVFEKYKVKAAVVACNTVTAVALSKLQKSYPFPVFGTTPPVLEAAKVGGEAFVLVTPATARSEALKYTCARAREETGSNVSVFALDGLAGAIETSLTRSPSEKTLERFLSYLPKGNPQAVVLGCTHYSYIKTAVESFYRCPVFDSSEYSARAFLSHFDHKSENSRPFLTTSKNLDPKQSLLTPLDHDRDRGEIRTKANVRSSCFSKNPAFSPQKGGFSSIFFLGSGKMVNKSVYEQMFAIPK